MQDWSEHYHQILTNAGLETWLFGGYVDDERKGTTNLKMGMRFSKDKKKFFYKEEWKQEDRRLAESGPSITKRVSRECNKAMNTVNEDLKFT